MSAILGENRDIYFPKLSQKLHLVKFSEIAKVYLQSLGYEPYLCESEEEARSSCEKLIRKNKWPCYFFESDTSGEKDFEEFFTDKEALDLVAFHSIGIIKNNINYDNNLLDFFEKEIIKLKQDINKPDFGRE